MSALLEAYVEGVRWQFAKTMPQWPHWYTMRQWAPGKEAEFDALARAIFSEGYQRKFGRRVYRYLDLGPYQYWSMDPTPEETDLINRALRPA